MLRCGYMCNEIKEMLQQNETYILLQHLSYFVAHETKLLKV